MGNLPNLQHVIWLVIAKEALAIWMDFETRILGLSLPGCTKPAWRLRLAAAGILLVMRLATCLGIQVGHGGFQALVALHDRKLPVLANARRDVFGDGEAHIL